ncbi:hypothetical protein OF83DRAFT_1167877 [Amylostereum chailletii]|nr:hypothetical protein OF83DRAFT_1167877 [Amylostereum chailletii]
MDVEINVNPASATAFWLDAAASRLNFLDNVASNATREDPSNAIETLRSELLAMDRAVSFVKRRLNAAMPVARLHPDILAIIFAQSELEEPHCNLEPIDADFHRAHRTLGWIKVSHVSHQWREVALSCPSLWSVVTFAHGFQWAQEFVSRSKSMPILVNVCAPPSRAPGPVGSLVESQLHRTHTLHLCCPAFTLSPSNLCRPVPLLHTLRARSLDIVSDGPLSSALFAGQTPSLRTLTATEFRNLDWSAPTLGGLTSLWLKTEHELSPSSLSIPDVLDALRRMPRLETLQLHVHNVGEHPDEPLPYMNDVHLPSLTLLDLGDMHMDSAAAILDHIRRPHSTRIKLSCIDEGDEIPGLKALTRHLENIPSMHELQSLHAYTEWVDTHRVKHGLSVWKEFTVDPVGEMPLVPVQGVAPAFQIELEYNTDVEPIDAGDLCNLLPFRNVRAISLVSDTIMWNHAVDGYLKVEHIHALEYPVELLESLRANAARDVDRSTCLLPSLRTIWLENVDWDDRSEHEDRRIKETLRDVVRERGRIGAPIHCVYVEQAKLKGLKAFDPGVRVVGVKEVH